MIAFCVLELTQQLSEKYELPLKTGYNSTRGFHLTLYCGGKEGYSIKTLPAEFIKKTKQKNTITFTVADLVCTVENYIFMKYLRIYRFTNQLIF